MQKIMNYVLLGAATLLLLDGGFMFGWLLRSNGIGDWFTISALLFSALMFWLWLGCWREVRTLHKPAEVRSDE